MLDAWSGIANGQAPINLWERRSGRTRRYDGMLFLTIDFTIDLGSVIGRYQLNLARMSGPHTIVQVSFDVGAGVRGGQCLCRLARIAPFFVVIGRQCIVSLNKETTEVKYNTLVNDETSFEVSACCADIPHERSVLSGVEL